MIRPTRYWIIVVSYMIAIPMLLIGAILVAILALILGILFIPTLGWSWQILVKLNDSLNRREWFNNPKFMEWMDFGD